MKYIYSKAAETYHYLREDNGPWKFPKGYQESVCGIMKNQYREVHITDEVPLGYRLCKPCERKAKK
tara:strand:+ start:304 stop:501 length:198 start_codon:yes stop_codon:yes gene_type:complete